MFKLATVCLLIALVSTGDCWVGKALRAAGSAALHGLARHVAGDMGLTKSQLQELRENSPDQYSELLINAAQQYSDVIRPEQLLNVVEEMDRLITSNDADKKYDLKQQLWV